MPTAQEWTEILKQMQTGVKTAANSPTGTPTNALQIQNAANGIGQGFQNEANGMSQF